MAVSRPRLGVMAAKTMAATDRRQRVGPMAAPPARSDKGGLRASRDFFSHRTDERLGDTESSTIRLPLRFDTLSTRSGTSYVQVY